ncbi:hypothetical protein M408DRAFT_28393 [Serendipita vermifera MAFF 305830]|uniref:Phosphatidylinositol transfer protein SFH5 n=1 Tax=Serendipita vermifera MAFF 305830 TaxID=933852 RepID=A0A0C3AS28_SERVB|nr:hypothetical protein M408DRAFT_28393 [Serendipita vermifera MAFF 305830]
MSSDAPAVETKPETQEPVIAPKPAAPEAAATVAEPQDNELTKKFTEEERSGVKALRAKLAEIAEEVYEDNTKHITLWGVELSPTHPTAESSVVLVKFLRAREGDLKAAEAMLIATLKWRREFKVDDLKTENFPEDVFGKVGVISGKDKDGRPVTYNFYGAVDPNVVFKDVDQFIRWRVNLMEKGISLINFSTVDSMVQVHDYAGVSLMGGRTPNSKAAAGKASQIFADYYPELLHKKFFVSVPVLLTWIFYTFTKLLSPATQNKMSVVGSGPATIAAALHPIIDDAELPKRYGGAGEDI